VEDPAARYRAALPALKRLSPMPELISTAAALQLLSAELRPGRRFTVGVEAECIRRETASAAAVASAGRATAHAAVWRRAHPPHPSPPQATSDDLDSRASATPRMPRVPPSPHPTGVAPGTPVTPQMSFSTPSVYHTHRAAGAAIWSGGEEVLLTRQQATGRARAWGSADSSPNDDDACDSPRPATGVAAHRTTTAAAEGASPWTLQRPVQRRGGGGVGSGGPALGFAACSWTPPPPVRRTQFEGGARAAMAVVRDPVETPVGFEGSPLKALI
jgi:hypothetical protein